MSDTLCIRAYNVLFGDAVLVAVPEKVGRKKLTRHILIDVGNILGGHGGDDSVFEPVLEDVLAILDGRTLDLYVMTHEHMDHVQGLYYASKHFGLNLNVDYAWLTASSHPEYYDRFPEARKQRDILRAAYLGIERFLSAAPDLATPIVKNMLLNNDYRSTAVCVDHLRMLARRTSYIYRGHELKGTHPFREAKLEVWGPELDTTAYYGRLRPLAMGTAGADGTRAKPRLIDHVPPRGVDAGAFFDLIEARRSGYGEALLEIDRAANNTSIVFTLEWRGWTLLFPGDAEHRSWKTIKKHLSRSQKVL